MLAIETREEMRNCERCGGLFHWRKSTSTLKMTYCGIFCESGHLGFTIDGLEETINRRATISP